MEPANLIISALGGVVRVSELRGVNRSAVWKWSRSGIIPLKHIRPLLRVAREKGLDLTAEDFLPPDDAQVET